MKELKINREKFVDWYLDDDTSEIAVRILLREGRVSLQRLLKDVGYIPLSIVVNKDDVNPGDINEDPPEISNPNDFYHLRLDDGIKDSKRF